MDLCKERKIFHNLIHLLVNKQKSNNQYHFYGDLFIYNIMIEVVFINKVD